MKKIKCFLLIFAVLFTSGTGAVRGEEAEAASSKELFSKYGISKLALDINYGFERSSVGEDCLSCGFTQVVNKLDTRVIAEEDGNKALRIASFEGEALTHWRIDRELTGVVVAQCRIKVDGDIGYNHLLAMTGIKADGTNGEAVVISSQAPRSLKISGWTGSMTLTKGVWTTITIAADTDSGTFDFYANGERLAKGLSFSNSMRSIKGVKFTSRYNGENHFYVDDIMLGAKNGAALADFEPPEPPDLRPNLAYPQEMVNFTNEDKRQQRAAAEWLQEEITRAITAGEKELVIPDGYYRFGRCKYNTLTISGASDMIIRGDDINIIQESSAMGILIDNCQNVVVQGFRLDYDPLKFTQGEIVSIDRDNKSITMKIDNGYPVPDSSWAKNRIFFYEPTGEIPLPTHTNDETTTMNYLGNKLVEFKTGKSSQFEPFVDLKVGCRVVTTYRAETHAVQVRSCDYCTLRDFHIYGSTSYALNERYGKGRNTYDGLRIIKRPGTNRLHCASADGFHSAQCENGPIIENSEISYTDDDIINIRGFFSMVYDIVDDNTLLIMAMGPPNFEPGTELEFYDFETMKFKGTATALSYEIQDDPRYQTMIAQIPDYIKGELAIDCRSSFYDAYIYKVKLDKHVDLLPYDIFCSNCKANSAPVIRNNYFHNGFVRGILMRSIGPVIENNRFSYINGPAIYLSTERRWFEAPFADNAIIRDNIIDNCCYAESNHSVTGSILVMAANLTKFSVFEEQFFDNITIEDNVINNSGSCGIYVVNANNLMIKNNTINHPWSDWFGDYWKRAPKYTINGGADGLYSGIFVGMSKNVTVDNNTITNLADWCEPVYIHKETVG